MGGTDSEELEANKANAGSNGGGGEKQQPARPPERGFCDFGAGFRAPEDVVEAQKDRANGETAAETYDSDDEYDTGKSTTMLRPYRTRAVFSVLS